MADEGICVGCMPDNVNMIVELSAWMCWFACYVMLLVWVWSACAVKGTNFRILIYEKIWINSYKCVFHLMNNGNDAFECVALCLRHLSGFFRFIPKWCSHSISGKYICRMSLPSVSWLIVLSLLRFFFISSIFFGKLISLINKICERIWCGGDCDGDAEWV